MKFKIISHRGNIDGPTPDSENTWDYIIGAFDEGYECEVDLWYLGRELFLGHDEPIEPIKIGHFCQYKRHLWVHCKNIKALEFCNKQKMNGFYHQNDDCTLTRNGYIWTYPRPNLYLGKTSIQVLPELINMNKTNVPDIAGVCTDYPINW